MANDFSGDSNCVALWRFENGALTSDSKGSNTLTDANTVGTSTADYKEGSASADFEKDNSEYFYINDADLSSDFPCKNGSGNGTFSICMWVKFESFIANSGLVSKLTAGVGNGSFGMTFTTASNKLTFSKRKTDGTFEALNTFPTVFQTGRWYHIAVQYNNSDKTWLVRIWDDTAGDFLDSDQSGTAADYIYYSTQRVEIGTYYGAYFDGLIDEIVVFNDILTTDEIDQIRAGTYGSGSSSILPIIQYYNSHARA